MLDKYRLEQPIGQGGMGSVWRAIHVTIERPVAIKFLDGAGASAERRAERFLREAKIAASVRHRHVVDILDYGVLDGTQPFIVMELLEGKTLAAHLSEVPTPTDVETLSYIAMVLSGLAAVHAAGIVHRDMKPENVLLVDDGDAREAKIVDFGISRVIAPETGPTGRITKTGGIVGTPEYMSPEQARGLRDIDSRSDLFSMGVVLYESLAGVRPFESENAGDVLIMIATQVARPLALLRPDLPEELSDLVDRALSRDRVERFQSAKEMRDALVHATTALSARTLRRKSAPEIERQESRRTRSPESLAPSAARSTASGSSDSILPYTARPARAALLVGALVIAVAATAISVWSSETTSATRERSMPEPSSVAAAPEPAVESPPRGTPSEPITIPPTVVERSADAVVQEPSSGVALVPAPPRPPRHRARAPAPSTVPSGIARDLDY